MTAVAADFSAAGPVAPTLPRRDWSSGSSGHWQRELLRAQARAWFHGPLPAFEAASTPPADAGAATEAVGRTPAAAQGRIGEEVATAAAVGRSSDPCGTAPHAMEYASTSRPAHHLSDSRGGHLVVEARTAVGGGAPPEDGGAVLLPVAAGLPRGSRAGAAQPPLGAQAQRREAPPPATASQVSIHIEQGADGMRAWLGVPGDTGAVAVRAEAICTELRRALQPLQRGLVVVCNGQTIYSIQASGRKELP